MPKIPDRRVARAGFIRSLERQREAQHAAARTAAANLPEPDRKVRLEDAFHDAYRPAPQAAPAPTEHGQVPRENPWDRIIQTLTDDDSPLPPVAPTPTPTPPMETRVRQEAMATDDLFRSLESRLTTTPEAVALPADAVLRRAFRELPATDREKLAAVVQREDYGMIDYFAARNYQPDYINVLIGHSLAKRYADAQRLQSGISPADLLQALLSDPAN